MQSVLSGQSNKQNENKRVSIIKLFSIISIIHNNQNLKIETFKK